MTVKLGPIPGRSNDQSNQLTAADMELEHESKVTGEAERIPQAKKSGEVPRNLEARKGAA